jgi:hypothetical protein
LRRQVAGEAIVVRYAPEGFQFALPSEQESLERAEAEFRRVLALQSDWAEARVRLGRVLELLGRSEAAVVELDAGLVEAVDAAWRDLEGRGRNAAELMAALHRLSKIRPDL